MTTTPPPLPDDAGAGGGDDVALWVGAYPAAGPQAPAGTSEGVWRVRLDPATGALEGALALAMPAPSFVATHPSAPVLYAVGETAPGTVAVLDVTPAGRLLERSRVASGGDHPCHVLVHPDGRALYVTNYSTGEVAVVPLDADGGFGAGALAAGGPTQAHGHAGAGPRTDRQEGPHAHSALLAPGGDRLLVADLGTDELRRYRVTAEGLEPDGVAHAFAPGTGPRHVGVGPGDHLYVTGELDVTVHVLAWDRATGTAAPVQVLPACATPVVTGRDALPSHVAVDGDRVLVGVRGPDVVARFAVHDGGARLEHLDDVPVGPWPRHHAVVGGALVTAVQGGDEVTARRADAVPGPPEASLAVPVPACVVPARA